MQSTDATLEQRINAFLAMIRQFESGNDYSILYGGAHFTDFSQHPYENQPLPRHSAAGAYQFILATWLRLKTTLALTDFSPASQDAAAYELLGEKGVINALADNNFNLALKLASGTWASLPYSTAGQNPKTLQTAINTYDNYLSTIA